MHMVVCIKLVTENHLSNDPRSLKKQQKNLSPKFSQIHIAAISTECFSDGIWVEMLSFSVLLIDTANCSCIARYVL